MPWTFTAGANIDVHPNVEVGTEFRYWLYRQYEKQHTDITGIFLVRELETIKYLSRLVPDQRRRSRARPVGGAAARSHARHEISDRTPAPSTSVTLDQPTFNHIGLHSACARYGVGRMRFGLSYLRYWYDIPTVTASTTMPPSNFRGHGVNNIFTLSVEAKL